MTEAVLAKAGGEFDTVAVTVGPGSFTGLRVGLAFAKGLRLARNTPLIPLGSLAGLAASAGSQGLTAGVVDARRGQVYVQAFEGDLALMDPDILPMADAAARLTALGAGFMLVGSGAAALAELLPGATALDLAAPDLDALGRLAAVGEPVEAVSPLYLRPPDAKPMAAR